MVVFEISLAGAAGVFVRAARPAHSAHPSQSSP
jgi:hypothetical protein